MREFFRGWRRKVGLVTLILAAAISTAWCRSLMVRDQFNQVSGSTMRQLISEGGSVCWSTCGHFDDFLDSAMPESGWLSQPATDSNPTGSWDLSPWQFNFAGFKFSQGKIGRSQSISWAVPYWSLACLLTLLAAYLILWKPKPKEPRRA